MSSERFEQRSVYVTGAASGIGQAAALRFAAEGARVFVADVNQAGVGDTVASIRDAGGTADGGSCDVSNMESVRTSVERAVHTFGGLDILVNAAGIGHMRRFEEIDEAEWQRVIGINLNGPFHTTRAALAHLLKRPKANIVNVASIAALRGQAYNSLYCASKAGMLNFTRAIALEFASRSLRANCVCPGGVITPLLQHFLPPEGFEQQIVSYYFPPVPGQMGEPADIASAIAFLASDEARMINGVALVADFGAVA
jgi:meso-butanediol dehydrogenase/(S,S)-butanediol dehydrogenase/diacetyl reductase